MSRRVELVNKNLVDHLYYMLSLLWSMEDVNHSEKWDRGLVGL